LARGDHELAVVPGHIALLVAHHPHIRVGDVRPRPGVVAVGVRLIQRPLESPGPSLGCGVPGLLPGPLHGPARAILGGQPADVSELTQGW
jgi:hypothetical protein